MWSSLLTPIRREGYGHLSKTLATQTGMTTPWLDSEGLLLVRHLWVEAQGYTRGPFVRATVVIRPVQTRTPWRSGGRGGKPRLPAGAFISS
jgi:hypothetical protein